MLLNLELQHAKTKKRLSYHMYSLTQSHTTSHEAVQVLTGAVTLDRLLLEDGTKQRNRKEAIVGVLENLWITEDPYNLGQT